MDDREELIALRRMAELEAKVAGPPPTPVAQTVSGPQSAVIGMGHAFDRLAAGLRQAVSSVPGIGPGVAGGIERAGTAIGMAPGPSIAPEVQQANETAYAQLRQAHPVGTFVGDLPLMMAAKTPAGMGLLSALEYGSPTERLTRGGLAYAGGKAGEYIAGKIGAMLAPKPALNPVRDATIQAARNAGYVLPPTQVNPEAPGVVNRLAEGFSGKIQTAQLAAIKNQQITNELARKAVGLESGTPITREALSAIRTEAGKAYDAVAQIGTINAGEQYGKELGQVIGPYMELKGQFPSQAIPKIDALIPDLTQQQMQSGAVINLVKRLRKDGFANIKSPDPETQMLGRVQVGAQNALENMLDTNLQAAGDSTLLQAFRAARALIAKTHTVENALEESTGKVVAANVKRAFAKGVPLTGELETIGRTAQAFPKALQNINTSMPGVSPLDYAGGVLGGVISGQPLVAATPLARPLVRAGLLSGPYQNLITSGGISPETAQLLGDLLQRGGGLLGGTAAVYGR